MVRSDASATGFLNDQEMMSKRLSKKKGKEQRGKRRGKGKVEERKRGKQKRQKMESSSRGKRQHLSMTIALIPSPKVLFLKFFF
jgi:ABC-type uncharacterized transport system ATPase component